jgi:hypothetical protein
MHSTVLRLPSFAFGLLAAVFTLSGAVREPDLVLPLWPGTPPGETRARGEEHRVGGRPRPV